MVILISLHEFSTDWNRQATQHTCLRDYPKPESFRFNKYEILILTMIWNSPRDLPALWYLTSDKRIRKSFILNAPRWNLVGAPPSTSLQVISLGCARWGLHFANCDRWFESWIPGIPSGWWHNIIESVWERVRFWGNAFLRICYKLT